MALGRGLVWILVERSVKAWGHTRAQGSAEGRRVVRKRGSGPATKNISDAAALCAGVNPVASSSSLLGTAMRVAFQGPSFVACGLPPLHTQPFPSSSGTSSQDWHLPHLRFPIKISALLGHRRQREEEVPTHSFSWGVYACSQADNWPPSALVPPSSSSPPSL